MASFPSIRLFHHTENLLFQLPPLMILKGLALLGELCISAAASPCSFGCYADASFLNLANSPLPALCQSLPLQLCHVSAFYRSEESWGLAWIRLWLKPVFWLIRLLSGTLHFFPILATRVLCFLTIHVFTEVAFLISF